METFHGMLAFMNIQTDTQVSLLKRYQTMSYSALVVMSSNATTRQLLPRTLVHTATIKLRPLDSSININTICILTFKITLDEIHDYRKTNLFYGIVDNIFRQL